MTSPDSDRNREPESLIESQRTEGVHACFCNAPDILKFFPRKTKKMEKMINCKKAIYTFNFDPFSRVWGAYNSLPILQKSSISATCGGMEFPKIRIES